MRTKRINLHDRLRRLAAHLLNISPEEGEKVAFSWGMKLFLATGHIIGHTVFLSLVTSQMGIDTLPYFLVGSAVLAMISTLIATPLLERLSKEKLITGTALLGAGALPLAAFSHNAGTGLAVVLIGFGAVMTQLGIVLALYIEEQYTPFESQRTFPIIESAEVVGALFGGVLISSLTHKIHLEGLMLLWASALVLLVCMIGLFTWRSRVVPSLKLDHHHAQEGVFRTLREGVAAVRRVSFLRILGWSVFLIAAVDILMEFQYTRAIAQGHGGASAESISHGLGLYVMIFSGTAIILQLFFSSRIIRRLGVIPSMLVNPLVSLAGFIPMLLNVTLLTAGGARLLFEVSQVLHKDAYLSSFYAVSHRIRERAKALIEGWIMPLGAVAGTVLLVIAEQFVHEGVGGVVTGIILAATAVTTILILVLRRHYTQLSVVALTTGDLHERHLAIEVLGGRGHVNAHRHLTRRLTFPNEPPSVKEKVLEALGRTQHEGTIPAILDAFNDAHLAVKIAAVESLTQFHALGEHFERGAFTRYRMITDLKNLFVAESSSRLKLAIMRLFAHLRAREIIPFLLKVLREGSAELQADCIQVIGSFRDPSIAHFLRPYLQSGDPRLASNAIISLWQFETERLNLLVQLVKLLGSKDRDGIISALYVLGELRSHQERATIDTHLTHEDPKIRRHAAIALLKLEDPVAIDHLMPIILGKDPMESYKARQMLDRVPAKERQLVKKRIHQEVSSRVRALLHPVQHDARKLTRIELMELIRLYDLAEQDHEVEQLKAVLAEKQRSGVPSSTPATPSPTPTSA